MPRSMAGYLCSHYRRYSKTPPLCFALQNIGEVSEGRRGKKNAARGTDWAAISPSRRAP